MQQSNWHVLAKLYFGLMTVFLVLGNDESNDSSSASSSSSYYYSNASMKLLRFHDFEPRSVSQVERQQVAAHRESRGFHFNPSSEDVNVDFEFIVPFISVPAKRSIKMARAAIQRILNLQTGALINTAVIVAAGAIIAGIVRLVLAPIVFTTLDNGFGYRAKQFEEPTAQRGDDNGPRGRGRGRGMRSLSQVLESELDEHNIDVSVCAQRAICQYLQHNAAQLHRHGHNLLTPGPARLIDVLANSRWMDSLLNGTAVFNAIDVARSQHDCTQIYRKCKWPQLQSDLWPNIINFLNARFFH